MAPTQAERRSCYTSEFYERWATGSETSAAVIVPLLLSLVQVRSAIDVGCGVGTWTQALMTNGVNDVQAVDGSYVDISQLRIPRERFLAHDLTTPLRLDRQFDLALCLEVAEHLPPARAPELVRELVTLAPCILFSAAIPGQDGTNHVNEQHLSYWVRLFKDHGYISLDAIRPHIQRHPLVEWWYQQNIAVFAAPNHPLSRRGISAAHDMVHPVLYDDIYRFMTAPDLGWVLRQLPGAVRRTRLFQSFLHAVPGLRYTKVVERKATISNSSAP